MQSLTLESATEKSARPAWRRLLPRLHVKAFTGGLIVLTFIVVGILGPALAPHDPNKQELTAMMKAPARHRLAACARHRQSGTRYPQPGDSWLARFAVGGLCRGLRLGIYRHQLGAISGYFGGKVDFLIQKLVEVVWAFPPLLLGITIMAFLGQGLVQSDSGAGGATLDSLLPRGARPDIVACARAIS